MYSIFQFWTAYNGSQNDEKFIEDLGRLIIRVSGDKFYTNYSFSKQKKRLSENAIRKMVFEGYFLYSTKHASSLMHGDSDAFAVANKYFEQTGFVLKILSQDDDAQPQPESQIKRLSADADMEDINSMLNTPKKPKTVHGILTTPKKGGNFHGKEACKEACSSSNAPPESINVGYESDENFVNPIFSELSEQMSPDPANKKGKNTICICYMPYTRDSRKVAHVLGFSIVLQQENGTAVDIVEYVTKNASVTFDNEASKLEYVRKQVKPFGMKVMRPYNPLNLEASEGNHGECFASKEAMYFKNEEEAQKYQNANAAILTVSISMYEDGLGIHTNHEKRAKYEKKLKTKVLPGFNGFHNSIPVELMKSFEF